ncbi:ATP-binding cassette domain-containing protein [candidate division KSB1 bacterium]|nr:ATP-binding cassette domain-containing protein [candidate division KSB1 bacterium]MCH8287385.1 ATP-binding cassette domain-containing protein [candidate division KSB1 bacterium]
MSTLLVENINKSFGNFQAVKDLSFSIEEGTMFGLLGPNGAGKTTTIRMIMDIIIPDSGTISVLGNNKPREVNDFIGYLPEERGLYRKMKVGELLLFMAELKTMKRKEAKKEINDWLERLDLMEWKNKKVEELSKGMQQKLQFIGTILHKPKLLILDEPFMGLDPINTDIVRNIMLEFKNNGTTIIFSTHLMENAEKLCEQILLIDHGEIILSGKLKDLKKDFGKMNVIIEFEGEDSFLKESKQIKSYDNFGNYVEIKLVENADSQELLRDAMKSAEIRKFELVQPSLHEIFVETVQKSNPAN